MIRSIKNILFVKIFSISNFLSVLTILISGTLTSYEIPYQQLASNLHAKSGNHIVTAEQLAENSITPHSSSIKWLDNASIIYAIPPSNNKLSSIIEVLNVHTLKHRSLGEGILPKPSPDGKWIAFVDNDKGLAQLWLMKCDGSERRQLTHFSGGLPGIGTFHYDFAWSPNSQNIAIYHQPEMVEFWNLEETNNEEDANKSSAVDIEHSEAVTQKVKFHLININNPQPIELGEAAGIITDLSWMPNSQELIFMNVQHGVFFKKESSRTLIQSLRIQDGNIRTLTSFEVMQQGLEPLISPNGQQIAIAYDIDNPSYSYMPSICLLSLDADQPQSQPIHRLTYELKLGRTEWSRDGSQIYALRLFGAYTQIYAIDAKTGAITQITKGPIRINHYALSPDGNHFVWKGENAHGTQVIQLADSDGQNVRDLIVKSEVSQDIALSEVREIEWTVPDYPMPMRGLLILPLNYDTGSRYPLIVDIHGGGPGANISMDGGLFVASPLEWQLWTAKGYAVFVPEFRSSASFGSLAITRDEYQEHDLINRDGEDIMAGIDSLISSGIADGNRIYGIGFSAGAYRVNWLAVTTHRFAALISSDGWADDWFQFGMHPQKSLIEMYGGMPFDVPENYQKNSPIFHAKGASTPTLFLMGNPKLGGADKYDTVRWLYNALKGQEIDTKYIYYPDEGHGLNRKENRMDSWNRAVKWIEEHPARK